MPTAEQRKQKRRTKRDERKAIKLHSGISVGHSMPVPIPPDFGPSRFTPEDQAANPDMPMTRVIKDVLREGRWKEGFGEDGQPVFGDYTPEELQTILNNARLMMAAGHAINYGKSHGDDQLIIPTDELISPIDDIRLDNGVLWTSTYVTPEQAKYLSNPARKVSAGLFRNYIAGNGTRYNGRTMLHVAVTDRPVVDRQGPFIIALSNYVALGTWDENKHPRKGGKFSGKAGGGTTPAAASSPSSTAPVVADQKPKETYLQGATRKYKATYSKAKKIGDAHGVQVKSVRGQIHVRSDDPAKLDAAHKAMRAQGLNVKKRNKDPRGIVGGDKAHLVVSMKPRGILQRIGFNNAIALGTWNEAKHKRNNGKFASGGGSTEGKKSSKKVESAKKATVAAGAGLIAGAKIGTAEKVVGTGAKYAGKAAVKAATPFAKKAGKAVGSVAKKAGSAGAGLLKKAGKAAGQGAVKAAGFGSRKAGQLVVAAGRRGLKRAKKLGKRVAKVGVKGLVSAGRAGIKAAKSESVRKGVKAAGRRGLQVAGRIAKTVAKSPARKMVLRFNNVTMQSAIALANTLGGSSMDPTILAAINMLLEKFGVDAIPDGTPPEAIGPMLQGIAMGLGMEAGEDDELDDNEPNNNLAPIVTPPGADPTVAMNNLLTAVDKRIADSQKPILDAIAGLTAAAGVQQQVQVDEKKANWIKFRNALGKAGVAEAVLAEKDKLGEKYDWDTNLLEGLSPTIKMSNLVSAAGATIDPPALSTPANGVLTDEQVKARIEAKGGNVANIPGAKG